MNSISQWLNAWLSPKRFYEKTASLTVWLSVFSMALLMVGMLLGLFFAPPDYQQKDAFRIIYIHVPAAFLSMGLYSVMSFAALSSFVWRVKLADLMIKSTAPVGASLTVLALVTGSIWGKPMWGTWWIWDARLTTELILFFIYMGNIMLRSALRRRPEQAEKAVAIYTLIGFVDIPLIHFSVEWWQTLHQGPTLSRLARPSMAPEMLWPLIVMIMAFALMAASSVLLRIRGEIIWAERKKRWVKEVLC